MTMEAPPDGGTTNVTPTPPAGGGSGAAPDGDRNREPVQNLGDLKAAAEARDRYKSRVSELEQELATMKGADAAKRLQELEQERDAERDRATKLEQKIEQGERRDRRRQAVDAALQGVSPDHSETVALLLDGMASRGEVDLEGKNPTEAGQAARAKLAERFPTYFKPDGNAPAAGVPARGARDLGNVRFPTDMSPEELSNLSDEEFASAFGGGGHTYKGV